MTTVNQVNFEENNFYKVIFKQIAMSNAEAILGFPGSSSPLPPQKTSEIKSIMYQNFK